MKDVFDSTRINWLWNWPIPCLDLSHTCSKKTQSNRERDKNGHAYQCDCRLKTI